MNTTFKFIAPGTIPTNVSALVCWGLNFKRCSRCRAFLPASSFNNNKNNIDGLAYQCRQCTKSVGMIQRRSKSATFGRRLSITEKERKASRRSYYLKHRIGKETEYDARRKLQSAVRKGCVIKPRYCQHCNRKVKLSGHHVDYDQPFEVIWLCGSCHIKLHRRPEFEALVMRQYDPMEGIEIY